MQRYIQIQLLKLIDLIQLNCILLVNLSALQYPTATSDPNQIRTQELVEGKNSNYFVIKPVDPSLRNLVNYRTTQYERSSKQSLNATQQLQALYKLTDKQRSSSVDNNKVIKDRIRKNKLMIREVIRDLYSLTEEEVIAVKKFIQSIKKPHSKKLTLSKTTPSRNP